MKQLIVNADDFGLTENVNRGIIEAHGEGMVTSATLLANGLAFEGAAAASQRFPRLGIGVHLNLTEGMPVADASPIRTLVDRGGRLHMTPARLWAGIATGQVSLSHIEFELRAQVMKVIRAGIQPTHFDGHKHVHVLPRVSEIVIGLAREFRISAVRCPLEHNPHTDGPSQNRMLSRISTAKQFLVSRVVSKLARSFREKLERAGLHSPTHFYGLRQTGFLDASAIRRILENLRPGTSELMCHPGYRDVELERTGTRLLTEREIEIHGLIATSVMNLVVAGGIRLCNYRDTVALTQRMDLAA
jgi:predicted glycoside hydrolase/deacetylase ChbG (UPF0249 family)